MPTLAKYRGPWQGVDSSKPGTVINPSAATFINNFILRNGELTTRPAISFAQNNQYDSSRTNPLAGNALNYTGVNYYDGWVRALGNIHIITLSAGNVVGYADSVYYIDQKAITMGGVTTTNLNEAVSGNSELTPCNEVVINGDVYFSQLHTGRLYRFGLSGNLNPASVVAGGRYHGVLAQHLILANTMEGLGNPQETRVRWSGSGNYVQLDPGVDITAGFNDLSSAASTITGYATIGRNGYVFQSNGVTEMIPTGNSTLPFDFVDLFESSYNGIGCYYPQSMDNYGNYCCFLSFDDAYLLDGNNLKPIGGLARDAIFADIRKATSFALQRESASPSIIGSIIPTFRRSYTYPIYILAIPMGNISSLSSGTVTNDTASTVFWIYSVREDSWTRWSTSQGWVTGKIRFLTTKINLADIDSTQFVCVPFIKNNNNKIPAVPITSVCYFALDSGPTDTGDLKKTFLCFNTEEDASISFKIEEFELDKKPTIRKVKIIYRNLGMATITLAVANSDNTPNDRNTTTIKLGDTTADGRLMLAYGNVLVTGALPQLTVSRKAGDGPVSIVGIDLVGELQEWDRL